MEDYIFPIGCDKKMDKKKIGKWERLLMILIVGFINFGLFLINHIINDIYDIFEPHFIIYWGIMLIMSCRTGFFYISIWLIIRSYFGIIKVGE